MNWLNIEIHKKIKRIEIFTSHCFEWSGSLRNVYPSICIDIFRKLLKIKLENYLKFKDHRMRVEICEILTLMISDFPPWFGQRSKFVCRTRFIAVFVFAGLKRFRKKNIFLHPKKAGRVKNHLHLRLKVWLFSSSDLFFWLPPFPLRSLALSPKIVNSEVCLWRNI